MVKTSRTITNLTVHYPMTTMETTSKKPRSDKADILPSNEEQRQLQQLEILMKNNLLNLQAKELIQQIDASNKLSGKKVVEFLAALETDMKDTAKFTCHKRDITAEWVMQQSGYESLQFHNASADMSINYRSPSEITVSGSHVSHACVVPFYNIDVLVTMPASIIQSRDILNHSYFDKRKLFLAGLRKTLEKANQKKSERYKTFSFLNLKGDVRKPVLCIQPTFSDSLVFHIIPVVDEQCIKVVQLRPTKNNVRPASWMETIDQRKRKGISADAKEMDTSRLSPTPMYNTAILEDISLTMHHQILTKVIQPFDNVRGALILLKVWLRQRELLQSSVGFDSHGIALLVAYLVQSKRLSTNVAPEIAFQAILTFLQNFEPQKNILDFTSTAFIPRNQSGSVEEDTNSFVLRHPITAPSSNDNGALPLSYNVFWRLHPSALSNLQQEARKALQELAGNVQQRSGAFDRLFLQKRGFAEAFDQFFLLPVPTWSAILASVEESEEEHIIQRKEDLIEASLHWPVESFLAREAFDLVTRGLGDRIVQAGVQVISRCGNDDTLVAKLTEKYPSFFADSNDSTTTDKLLIVGVVLDKDRHQRKVERGPVAVSVSDISCCGIETPAEKAVREFKDFWGEKSQLRRFKDGAILESVVWEIPTVTSKPFDLIEEIASYILSRHLPFCLTQEPVRCRMGKLTSQYLLQAHTSSQPQNVELKVLAAFDELRSLLVSKLKSLPLRVDQLMAYTPELRYTGLYPAEPHLYVQLKYLFTLDQDAEYKPLLKPFVGLPFSLVTAPIPVIAKFEASGKWPTDAVAIGKCKTAFLLKIKNELWKQCQVLSIIHDDETLDVLVQGFIFRLQPFSNLETERIVLLEDAPTNVFLSDITPSQFAVNSRFVVPVIHHQAMKALQAQYPIFGETVKLLRLWLARHHLSGHLAQEALECIVATEFLHPSSPLPPSTASSAFLRSLQLLATFAWDEEPLIVDYSLIAGVESEDVNGSSSSSSAPVSANTAVTKATMSSEVRTLIATRFRSSKTAAATLTPELRQQQMLLQQQVHPSMYIVTSADKVNEFEPWLKQKAPEPVVLHMVISAAQHTVSQLHHQHLHATTAASAGSADLTSVFQSSSTVLRKCQRVLHFHEHIVSALRQQPVQVSIAKRSEDAEGDDESNAEDAEEESQAVVQFRDVRAGPAFASTMLFANTGKDELDLARLVVIANECRGNPVQGDVVQRLRSLFHAFALFFWDETDGAQIGVLWRPTFSQNRDFSVMDCRYRKFATVASNGGAKKQQQKKNQKNGKSKRKRQGEDEDSISDDDHSEDGSEDEEENDGKEQVVVSDETKPHYDEILQHMIVVSKGLLRL